ncbi:hypothetical protein [Moraxella lacunata]|uniref:hypothetical protein n=1 Tax=Moraxella lacunata TaxID=477 RepID=UPI003EE38047
MLIIEMLLFIIAEIFKIFKIYHEKSCICTQKNTPALVLACPDGGWGIACECWSVADLTARSQP